MTTILIVEDNEKNMKLARDVLQAKGYRTLEAVNGEEGVRLALDDFGAGHSNFDRVWRIRPEIVKLDRSLVQRALKSQRVARMLAQTRKARIPVVLFAEGGGGRPGDIKPPGGNTSFTLFPQMSGQAPLIGITSGYCFAGNAAVLGCLIPNNCRRRQAV